MTKTILAAASALALLAGAAAAVPITDGDTDVDVTADLAGLGLDATPFGTATADGTVFTFPITGGDAQENGDAVVLHEGSGVTLSAQADASVAATVGDFVIDTAAATVTGDIVDVADDVLFFEFGAVGDSGIDLEIAAPLAGALTDVFGAPDLTGAVFGVASVNLVTTQLPAPIPLPAGLPLLAVGLGGLVLLRRRT